MADITTYQQGQVSDEGKVNWRAGDSAVCPGDQSVYDTSTVQLAELGQVKVVGDRIFRYARANGTLKPGQALQIQIPVAGATGGALDPAGGKQITYFFTSAAASGTVAANYYAEGYVYFGAAGTSTQMGMQYRIKSHSAVATSGNATLYLYEPLKYSVLTTDQLVLMKNPFDLVQVNSTGAIYCPGICVVNATTNDYMWIQTGGPAPIICSASIIQGTPVTPANTGGVTPFQAATITSPLTQIVGYGMHVSTAGFPGMCWLTIEQ